MSGAAVAERTRGLAALLAQGARAVECDGDLVSGRQWFGRACREAARIGDPRALAEAALGLSGLWLHEFRTAAAALTLQSWLTRALAGVDPGSVLAVRLRARLTGEAAYRSGDPGPILSMLDEARSSGDPLARAEALAMAHHCLLQPEYAAQRRSLAAELIVASLHTGRRSDLLLGLLWQTVDLFLDADPHAGRALTELRTLLAEQDHLAVGFVVSAIEVMLAIRSGELDRAEELAHACARRGEAAGDADATWWHGSQLVAIRWYQGRLAELLPMLSELIHSPTLSTVDNSAVAAYAVAAAQAGDQPRARSALAELAGRGLAELPRASSWLATMAGVVEAAYLLDDADAAGQAYALLTPYAHLPMVGGLAIACFGSVEQALGVAALTTGDLDRAVGHLAAAVRHNLALAHHPAVIVSRRRLAQALRLRAEPADDAWADREAATAAADAAALGLVTLDGSPLSVSRHGSGWRVAYGHHQVVVAHRVGMPYLATLVANPGHEIPAVYLAAGLDAGLDAGLSSQPVLDRAAVQHYQERLAQLRRELDDARADGRSAEAVSRAERIRQEQDWILAELAAATGLSGRTRRFADNHERARIAVGKAIRRAVHQVAAADPAIGAHLTRSVRTGTRCAYWPS